MTPEEYVARCTDTETAEDVHSRMVPADLNARVAAAIREAVAAEREACAKAAEEYQTFSSLGPLVADYARRIARLIRARRQS